ncbi:MAG: bis-aminopropyl spermidine synthase family protein [Candidatus Fermentithermobacillus carboniphilus]|uniref:Bis-aminopropyl spermidine synthase family protein n=1 Tax=Candidatus Fermentithermobacillus carboniphilus TaxID=3085328 RepID=A0AAT9LA88_9FIRM|nr:MAG: bis-aminopropyl spermidine synthase family protein [Candidatus Fermentithermobacillus carboniphilus]
MQELKYKILKLLQTSDNIFDLLSQLNEYIGTVEQALSELKEQGLIAVSEGKIHARGGLTGGLDQDSRPETANPTMYSEPACPPQESDVPRLLIHEYLELAKDRPRPVTEYDQGYVTPESVMARVSILDSRGDLDDSRVFVLGDDDLTSLALALTGKPREIVVAEIDPRLVEFINSSGQKMKSLAGHAVSPVLAVPYDVRRPLPPDLTRKFSVCVTDPLETRSGFPLFLRRAAEALSDAGSTLLFALTDLECPPERWHEFQTILLRTGFVLKDLLKDCQRYVLPDNDFVFREYPGLREFKPKRPYEGSWYHASLVRAIAVRQPDPSWIVTEGESDIYMDRES